MRKWVIGGIVVALVFVAAGCKVVVTPAASNGWFFYNEGANGSGYYVNGPGTPPAGRGSALLTVDGTGRESIATGLYSGIGLATLNQLKYSTYQAFSGTSYETPTLSFDIDYDSSDASVVFQGRFVYVPSAGGTVNPGVWQTWNTMAGAASWYSSASGTSPNRPVVNNVTQTNPPCTQASFCTWSTFMTQYPNARIRPTVSSVPGLMLLRAGGPITGGFSGAVDNLILGFGGATIETNFEPGDGHVAVTQSNAASLGFRFVQETATGSSAFVAGPNGSDGAGSAHLTVNVPGGEGLTTGLFTGTRLKNFTFASYKTYMAAAGANAPTLQIDVDYDATDADTTYQGRVVFEPSVAEEAAVTNEEWQTWNPLTSASGWWQTAPAIVGGNNVGQECTQGSPCSFQELVAEYPDAAVRPITGQFGGQPIAGAMTLKAGSNWPGGFDGNVDSLTLGVKSGTVNGTVTYDFEG